MARRAVAVKGMAKRPACGAASLTACPNHDRPGAPWCVDCLPRGLREKAAAGEIFVIGLGGERRALVPGRAGDALAESEPETEED